MAQQIISQRVVDTRIINKPGIFGGIGNKFNSIGASIGGLCIAPFIFVLAFAALVYGESFSKSSGKVEELTLEQASNVDGQSGFKKIAGVAESPDPVEAPEFGSVLYYESTTEKYEQVEKVETETVKEVVNGTEVEKTIETTKLVDEWVEKQSVEEWAQFKLSKITIDPEDADLKMDFEEKVYVKKTGQLEYSETTNNFEPAIGDMRIVLKYLLLNEELIVVGDLSQNKISTGDVFIVSNLTNAELIETLESEENTLYWVIKIVTFILFMAGIITVVRPILEFVELIPIAGKAVTMAATVIAAVFAFIIVLIGSIIVKFWWLFLICAVILFALAIFGVITYFQKKKKG